MWADIGLAATVAGGYVLVVLVICGRRGCFRCQTYYSIGLSRLWVGISSVGVFGGGLTVAEPLKPTEAQRKVAHDALDEAIDQIMTLVGVGVSIPEGPPVGTIARRPDGKCLALRVEGEEPGTTYWQHLPLICGPGGFSHRDDTDSWPVIYDPTGKTIDELQAEIDRLNKNWDNGCDEEGFCPPFTVSNRAFESVVSECNGLKGALKDAYKAHPEIAPGYLGDPTAQQEPEACESCLGSGVGLGKVLGGWLETDCAACDATGEAQREPAECPCAPGSGHCVTTAVPKPSRTPRVLPSLDCEEARDGTVWQARYELVDGNERTPGWKFQYTSDGWVYERGDRVLSPEFLTDRGPYTEVIGDHS